MALRTAVAMIVPAINLMEFDIYSSQLIVGLKVMGVTFKLDPTHESIPMLC